MFLSGIRLYFIIQRKTYVYKQWTGKYDVDDVEEIDLSDKSNKIPEEFKEKLAEMESQPNHPKVKEARQHQLATKYYRPGIYGLVDMISRSMSIWTGLDQDISNQ